MGFIEDTLGVLIYIIAIIIVIIIISWIAEKAEKGILKKWINEPYTGFRKIRYRQED